MKEESTAALEPWKRQKGETASEYEKFCAYRDMRYITPPGSKSIPKLDLTLRRSLAQLSKQVGISRRKLGDLSSEHNWQSRVEAYDAYILDLRREKNEQEILDMQERHATIASEMIKKATRRLLEIQDTDISATDIVRLIDTGVKIERLSRGQSTENQNVTGSIEHDGAVKVQVETEPDLSHLSDEELEQLEALLEKAQVKPDE